MNCYAVWDKATNKQLRVFAYNAREKDDYKRAKALAVSMADSLHKAGYPSIVEHFGWCEVGSIVHDTEKAVKITLDKS